MKEDNNAEYLSVLATLGATISKYKGDLAYARYDIERLQKKLKEAEKELQQTKESKKNAEQCFDNGVSGERPESESIPD